MPFYLRERDVLERVAGHETVLIVVCMWSAGSKRKLRKIAAEQDAIVVRGCRGAVESGSRIVQSLPCRVYPGMEDEAGPA